VTDDDGIVGDALAENPVQVVLDEPDGVCNTGMPDGLFSNQKIPIWVNFGGSCNENCGYILCPFGLFYGH
jgi:hypothetical protein